MTTQYGACAKVRVICTLVHPTNGQRYVGENHVRKPQATCPRGNMPSGEGYELCRDVCDQVGHAEVVALSVAGKNAAGCTAYIEGRDYVCPACQVALVSAGVRDWVLGAPPVNGRWEETGQTEFGPTDAVWVTTPTTQREADERDLVSRAVDAAREALGWAGTIQDRRKAIDLLSAARKAINQSTQQAAPEAPAAERIRIGNAMADLLHKLMRGYANRVPGDLVNAGAALHRQWYAAPTAPQAAPTASASEHELHEVLREHMKVNRALIDAKREIADLRAALARAPLPKDSK